MILFLFVTMVLSTDLNHPCPYPPCLPNSVLLNAGIDLSTGNSVKGQVLSLTWGDNYYQNPNNGQYYQCPEGVSVSPVSETVDFEGTFLFINTSQSEEWQATQVVEKSDYIFGMYSHSSMTYQSMDSQYSLSRNTGYVFKNYAFYNTNIPANRQTLGSECYKDLMLLPETYNQQAYFEFIGAYGTHFCPIADWGIKYTFLSNYKQCIMYSHTESYTYDQVETDGWIKSEGHTTYSGSSQTDSYYSSRTMTSQTFDGGAVMYQSSDKWDLWVQSGADMINPIRTSFTVKPIYSIINDTTRKENMIRAYNEYFAMRKDQQDAMIEQKKFGPKDVTYALFKIADLNTVSYPIYTIAPTMTKLEAGQITNPIGIDGGCNHLRKVDYHSGKNGQYDNYYYCMDLFQCERNDKGQLRAKYFFDSDLWVNNVRGHDDCTNIRVNRTNYTAEKSDIFDWINQGGTYYGHTYESYTQNQFKQYPNLDWPYMYTVSYGYYNPQFSQWDVNKLTTTDGSYVDSQYSITSFWIAGCGGYFVCYLDCDYISIKYDPQNSIQVSCTC